MVADGNWTFHPFISLPPRCFIPERIQHFLLTQLKPKHDRLDVFNYSCHSVCMSC